MSKPRNRYKTRRPSRPTRTSRARKEAAQPQDDSGVGRASRPSPLSSASPSLPASPINDHLIEQLLRLWEHDDLALGDIADYLGLSLRALLALIHRPEVDDLLTQIEAFHERRTRQTALAKSRRALITLEQVQTEAEAAAQATPITPQATKAQRDARSNRNQRRLAATVTLNQLRVLKATTPKMASKVTPVSDRYSSPEQARAA